MKELNQAISNLKFSKEELERQRSKAQKIEQEQGPQFGPAKKTEPRIPLGDPKSPLEEIFPGVWAPKELKPPDELNHRHHCRNPKDQSLMKKIK